MTAGITDQQSAAMPSAVTVTREQTTTGQLTIDVPDGVYDKITSNDKSHLVHLWITGRRPEGVAFDDWRGVLAESIRRLQEVIDYLRGMERQ